VVHSQVYLRITHGPSGSYPKPPQKSINTSNPPFSTFRSWSPPSKTVAEPSTSSVDFFRTCIVALLSQNAQERSLYGILLACCILRAAATPYDGPFLTPWMAYPCRRPFSMCNNGITPSRVLPPPETSSPLIQSQKSVTLLRPVTYAQQR